MTLHPDTAHDLRQDADYDIACERKDAAVKAVLRGGRTPGGESLPEVLASFEYHNPVAYHDFVRFVGMFIDEELA